MTSIARMVVNRSFTAIAVMLLGAVIFGGDPARFDQFGFNGVSGQMLCGTIVFATGVVLRIKARTKPWPESQEHRNT